MSRYLAAFDIAEQRIRVAVTKVLQRFGHRIQESVFELQLDPDDLPDLRLQIGMHLGKTDCFDLYPIDDSGTRTQYRWQRPIERRKVVLLL